MHSAVATAASRSCTVCSRSSAPFCDHTAGPTDAMLITTMSISATSRISLSAVPPAKAAYAPALASAEQRRNFQTRAAPAAAPNDGVLLPQYLTPFVHDYPRATPSFVRHEAR